MVDQQLWTLGWERLAAWRTWLSTCPWVTAHFVGWLDDLLAGADNPYPTPVSLPGEDSRDDEIAALCLTADAEYVLNARDLGAYRDIVRDVLRLGEAWAAGRAGHTDALRWDLIQRVPTTGHDTTGRGK